MSLRNWSPVWIGICCALLSCRPFPLVAVQSSAPRPAPAAEGSLALFEPPDSGISPGISNFRFGLPVEIHGRMFQFEADHGATTTMVTDSTIEAVRLPHRFAHATRTDTLVRRGGVQPVLDSTADFAVVRGDSTFLYWGNFDNWLIDSIRVAGSLEEQVWLSNEPVAASLKPFGGLLGRDILSQFDLEFNLPERTLRLYTRSAGNAHGTPRWLPHGMTTADCMRANVIRHMGVDTTQMDSADYAETRTNPIKRIWEQEELQLPVVVNGRSFAGIFDSGSGEMIMNWAAARALGLSRTSRSVTAIPAGGHVLFSFRPAPLPGALDTMNYHATGITVRLGHRNLPADTVLISDQVFATFSSVDDVNKKPMIIVGLGQFRDDVLFLSYSTGKICVSGVRR